MQNYADVDLQSGIHSASPHKIILMLLDGALSRIATASGHLQRGAIAEKGKNIGLAISIIEGLRGSLDHERGGEIAANLDRLYDYMGRRLFEANRHNKVEYLEEVHRLLSDIRGAWVEIRSQVE